MNSTTPHVSQSVGTENHIRKAAFIYNTRHSGRNSTRNFTAFCKKEGLTRGNARYHYATGAKMAAAVAASGLPFNGILTEALVALFCDTSLTVEEFRRAEFTISPEGKLEITRCESADEREEINAIAEALPSDFRNGRFRGIIESVATEAGVSATALRKAFKRRNPDAVIAIGKATVSHLTAQLEKNALSIKSQNYLENLTSLLK